MTAGMGESEAENARQKTRDTAPDCYFSTLLAPAEKQNALFAVHAFDAEISGIASQVSDPAVGEIRLQWWYDTLASVFAGEPQQHPVAKQLVDIIPRYDLPAHLFTRLVDAHRFDIYREPMGDMEALQAYFNNTSVAITDLACRILIGEEALAIKELTEKCGTAWGMGRIIAAFPQQIARKQCFIPQTLLSAHQLHSGHVLAGEYSTSMKVAVLKMQHVITESLAGLRDKSGSTPKNALPALFPAGLAELKTRKITTSDFDPFRQNAEISQLATQWYLLKAKVLERL